MPHPIRIVVTDDLRRSRFTVLVRMILAIPHVIVLSIWSIGWGISIVFAWIIALVIGRVPAGLHAFIASWARYNTQVHAYLYLLANPYPPFSGTDPYQVDLEVAPAVHQNRLKILFRAILVLPALLVASLLFLFGVIVAILGWVCALALGRMPEGLRASGVWVLRFVEQTLAYTAMLTARYPQFRPTPEP